MKNIKKNMNSYKTIIVFISISIFLAYLITFGENGISNKSSDWSNFASFFGGIINPLLAFVNILVLIKLTLSIEESNKNRQDLSLKEAVRPYPVIELKNGNLNYEIIINNLGVGILIIDKIEFYDENNNQVDLNEEVKSFLNEAGYIDCIDYFKLLNKKQIIINKDDSKSVEIGFNYGEVDAFYIHISTFFCSFLNNYKIKIYHTDIYNNKFKPLEVSLNFKR